ncbi:Protein kinase-like domain [Pseudocohnilembus persalinus]|uniref:Protein kinase-like domain n=1 Tax=Pseudocohnilembus persalinus TaxID=266149 RepID=A0A0V0Q7Q4_PSEPJ|nr:Protein kinase-like domain [Pseudocohnilembus persalinus]|eukprot:KRW98280.1 Protein kinase-like domain [Pseudocohnilembus persalinus]
MGNQNSVNSKNFSDKSLENFYEVTTFERNSNDPCFGEIQIYRRSQNRHPVPEEQLVFCKQKQENTKQDYQELYREADLRLSYKHENLLNFLGYDFQCSENICGTSNKAYLYYQYYDLDLEYEIKKRSKEQAHFTEKEVLYILDSLINVCAYMQNNNIYHGDLRPQNILLSSNGKVKIGDHLLLNNYRNNYLKALLAGDEEVYISPELMNYLKHKDQDPDYNEFKSDVWSLGMTMLEICTLNPSIQCYDYESFNISFQVIQNLLSRAGQFYSFQTIARIKSLLIEDERLRPDFLQLRNSNLNSNLTSEYPSGYNSQYISPEKKRQISQSGQSQKLNLMQTVQYRDQNQLNRHPMLNQQYQFNQQYSEQKYPQQQNEQQNEQENELNVKIEQALAETKKVLQQNENVQI